MKSLDSPVQGLSMRRQLIFESASTPVIAIDFQMFEEIQRSILRGIQVCLLVLGQPGSPDEKQSLCARTAAKLSFNLKQKSFDFRKFGTKYQLENLTNTFRQTCIIPIPYKTMADEVYDGAIGIDLGS